MTFFPNNGLVATLAYSSNQNALVGTSTTSIATAGQYARTLMIGTLPASTSNVWLNISGGNAVIGSGILVAAGGGSIDFGGNGTPMPTGAISGITDGTSAQSVWLVGG